MPRHNLNVDRETFDLYLHNKKSLQIVVGQSHYSFLKINDTVIFNNDPRISRVIVDMRVYPSLVDLLAKEEIKRIHPSQSKVQILKYMRSKNSTSKEQQGVIVLELEPVKV